MAFRNLDLWKVLHGRILGFGRMAEVLVALPILGGTSIATRREGSWSDEELAHLFGFCLISLYHGAMAATRRGLPACPLCFLLVWAHLFSFGVASLVAAVAHGSWFS